MMKSVNEMQFQQISQNLQKQMQILSQRICVKDAWQKLYVHTQTLSQISTKIKNLNTTYNKIDTQIKLNSKNKNYNKYDLTDKLRKYLSIKQQLISNYENLLTNIQKLKKSYLFNKSHQSTPDQSNPSFIQLQNIQRANELINRFQGVNRQLQQTQNITNLINPQLNKQGITLDQMDGDAKETEMELSMTDQMMRIINNRNLMTKFIMVILILFMGMADLLLLYVKLT